MTPTPQVFIIPLTAGTTAFEVHQVPADQNRTHFWQNPFQTPRHIAELTPAAGSNVVAMPDHFLFSLCGLPPAGTGPLLADRSHPGHQEPPLKH